MGRLQWISNHDWGLVLGIRHSEPFERGHPAKFLIGCNEHCYKSRSPELDSNRQLQRIERSEGFTSAVLDEQLSSTAKMVVVHSRHQKPTTTQIGIQTAADDQHGLLIDFSSSDLQGKNGFHFYNSEAGDQVLGRPF